MNIITFCDVDESLFENSHNIEHFQSGVSEKADIIIINIDSILSLKKISLKYVKKNMFL